MKASGGFQQSEAAEMPFPRAAKAAEERYLLERIDVRYRVIQRGPGSSWVGASPPLPYAEADMLLRALRFRFVADRLGMNPHTAQEYALRHPGDFRRTVRCWLAEAGGLRPD